MAFIYFGGENAARFYDPVPPDSRNIGGHSGGDGRAALRFHVFFDTILWSNAPRPYSSLHFIMLCALLVPSLSLIMVA